MPLLSGFFESATFYTALGILCYLSAHSADNPGMTSRSKPPFDPTELSADVLRAYRAFVSLKTLSILQ